MKNKRLLVLSRAILVAVILLLLPLMACAKPAPPAPPAPAPAPTPAPAPPEVKTLKVGVLTNLGWPLGVEFKKLLDVAVTMYNEKGGLVIGGERYNIDIILYDTKMNPETGRAAVERLVHQDKVKFILGDETIDAWLPITESNKVLVIATTPSPAMLNPDNKYAFHASHLHTQAVTMWGWFAENHPKIKTVSAAYPDNMLGHALGGKSDKLAPAFGMKMLDTVYYPPGMTDFSAIALKIKTANPDMFTSCGGGPVQDSLLRKALFESGWKGQVFTFVGARLAAMAKIISLDIVEGLIAAASAMELDDPPPVAKEVKDAYIAKYGVWDDPDNLYLNEWHCLINGLEQAQSLDPDKVAAVIGNGMRFETTEGPSMMIARPDLGNPRTVDLLLTGYIKRVEGGKGKLIATIPIEQAFEYNKRFYGW